MNLHAAWLLVLPMMALANELPPPKAPPPKAAASPPITEVKAAKPAVLNTASEAGAKPASKHAAPQQMAEPIKLVKPANAQAPASAVIQSAAPEALKPTGQAVSRYVSPQFSTAQAEVHRPVVRSKAPTAHRRSAKAKPSPSYAIKPGLVRVLPASQIPSGAIVPPSQSIAWSSPANKPNVKPNVVWGAIEPEAEKVVPETVQAPVMGRKIASPKYYSETNPEKRWQHYSYP